MSRIGPALVALAVAGALALSAQPAGAAPGGGSAAGKPAPGPKAAATSRISGTVTDGSGHGYALFAKVEVVDRPDLVTWTDAVTGRYALDVVPGTYRVKVTSAYPGYVEDVGDVDASTDATHNARLTVAPTCQAAGYQVAYGTPVVKEGFDAVPAGWTVTNRTPSGGWTFADAGGRGNLTGGGGGFAIVDSDNLGRGNTQDTDLVTPVLDLTGVANPVIRWANDYRAIDNGSPNIADVDVTTDGGATWQNVWHADTTSVRGPGVIEAPLGHGGQAGVQARFHFIGTWAWWWEVDDVTIVNRLCSPVPGGLVVGHVTDATTGKFVSGASVASPDKPAEKAATNGDGFYWIFSTLTGAHTFTAAKSGYSSASKSVTVTPDTTVGADLALGSARLAATPNKIEAFVTLGGTRTATVNVKNTGTAPATVTVAERGGPTIPTMKNKSAAQTVTVGHVSKGVTPSGKTADPGKAAAKPPAKRPAATAAADPAWAPIADYPMPISDNAAVVDGTTLYVVGGGSGTGNEQKAFTYNPDNNAWSALPDMPHRRSKPQAAVLDHKVYVFGGWGAGGIPEPSVDVYDPAATAWSTLGATNPKPKSAAGTAVIGGKVYLIGGCLNANCDDSGDTVVFDGTGFSEGTAYPHLASFPSCAGLGEKVYCAGGTAGSTTYKDGFVYDGTAWAPIADLPIDLWGSADAAADGRLVMAGGITNGSTAVTNRTFAYDPAANAWTELAPSGTARARGAGSCGLYKVGGWSAPFTPAPDAERLSGMGDCAAPVTDVPWLTESPGTVTIEPGKSANVTVTMAAKIDAIQPGTYSAQLVFNASSPFPVPTVDVVFHINPPDSWGKVTGTVTGTMCNTEVVPVPATVQLNGANGREFTLKADKSGHFEWWMPRSTYQTIVAKDGWIPQVRSVRVPAGLVTTADFNLKPSTSCGRKGGQQL